MSGSARFALDSGVLLFDYFAGESEIVTEVLRESVLNEVTISETLMSFVEWTERRKHQTMSKNVPRQYAQSPRRR